MRTVIAGQLVELPGTIAAIRAALDEDRAKAFDAEIPMSRSPNCR